MTALLRPTGHKRKAAHCRGWPSRKFPHKGEFIAEAAACAPRTKAWRFIDLGPRLWRECPLDWLQPAQIIWPMASPQETHAPTTTMVATMKKRRSGRSCCMMCPCHKVTQQTSLQAGARNRRAMSFDLLRTRRLASHDATAGKVPTGSVIGQPLVICNPSIRRTFGAKTQYCLPIALTARDLNVKTRLVSADVHSVCDHSIV